jgi:hypothetical protein
MDGDLDADVAAVFRFTASSGVSLIQITDLDLPRIHRAAGLIPQIPAMEPAVKRPRVNRGNQKNRGYQMKKFFVVVALAGVVGAFAGRPSTAVQSQASRDTISPLAMMMTESRSLPSESYDAI